MAKTKAQYIAEALAEMEKATWPPEKWCAAIQDGYPPGHEYDWMVTPNYRAQIALYHAAHPESRPPVPLLPTPTPPAATVLALYVLFAAQEPQQALPAPSGYTVALSADRAYRDASIAAIKPLRDKGHKVAGWCDCRPAPDGTPAAAGVQFVQDQGLDYFIGQAEQPAEFDDAISVHAPVVVGNITSLRQVQIDRIMAGEVAFIQEDYWNEGWARADHPGISAYCAGIYPALWNPQIQAYRDAGRWRQGDGLYHVAAVQDWENLP